MPAARVVDVSGDALLERLGVSDKRDAWFTAVIQCLAEHRIRIIALNAVGSLITIISIYREGGILKRLRATPLRPPVILASHVMVKPLLSGVWRGDTWSAHVFDVAALAATFLICTAVASRCSAGSDPMTREPIN